MLDTALVSADQPSLGQRGDKLDARHGFVRRVGAASYTRRRLERQLSRSSDCSSAAAKSQ